MRQNWDEQADRLLLYADIMGFKDLVKKDQIDHDLYDKLNGLVEDCERRLSPMMVNDGVKLIVFSDLIVVAANGCGNNEMNWLVNASAVITRLCLERGMVLNGCIAKGALLYKNIGFSTHNQQNQPVVISEPLLYGQSLIDAHLLCEDLFCYGIFAHPSVETIIRNNPQKWPWTLCKVLIKSGGDAPLYYLDWPKVRTAYYNQGTEVQLRAEYEDKINAELKNPKVRVRAYAQNTQDVLNQV